MKLKRIMKFKSLLIKIMPYPSTGEHWKVKPGLLVDQLSVYLALSNDIRNKPDQLEFTYQVDDQDGVKYLKFIVVGFESYKYQ